MPIFGAIIGAGAALIGDSMSSSSQSDTNAMNAQINQQNIQAAWGRQMASQQFNADQGTLARQFSAQQVANQEQFQKDTQAQAENWDEQMSNTAMQRRMADLKAAGLNPLLAVGQGGASAPIVSGLQGNIATAAQASAGPAGAPGPLAMQNPGAAFGNLGGQINGAIQASQTGAQIDLMRAQANKVNAEAGTEIPAQVQYLKSMTGLNDQQANQAYYNTQLIEEKIYGQRLDNETLRDITMPKGQVDLSVVKATRDALVSAAQSDATAKQLGLAGLRNLNDVQSGNMGKALAYLNAILAPTATAAHAAGAIIP